MTTLASDNFNRADGTSLGANWTVQVARDSPAIGTNEATVAASPLTPAWAYYSGTSFPADQWAEGVIGSRVHPGADEGAGPSVRMTSTGSAYGYFVQGGATDTRLYLYNGVNGYTQLGTTAGSVGSGDTLRLEIVGTSLTVKKNGSTYITATDSTLSTGAAGLWLTGASLATSGSLDSWQAGDFEAGSGGGKGWIARVANQSIFS